LIVKALNASHAAGRGAGEFVPGAIVASQQEKSLLPETFAVEDAYLPRQHHAGFHSLGGFQMRFLIAAAVVSAFAVSPASAAMMKCTSDNMMKSTSMMTTMPESPGKMAANKEIGMANTDMSNGKMGSACKHYMKAQKAAMMK
jgi:hypothetical protein